MDFAEILNYIVIGIAACLALLAGLGQFVRFLRMIAAKIGTDQDWGDKALLTIERVIDQIVAVFKKIAGVLPSPKGGSK